MKMTEERKIAYGNVLKTSVSVLLKYKGEKAKSVYVKAIEILKDFQVRFDLPESTSVEKSAAMFDTITNSTYENDRVEMSEEEAEELFTYLRKFHR